MVLAPSRDADHMALPEGVMFLLYKKGGRIMEKCSCCGKELANMYYYIRCQPVCPECFSEVSNLLPRKEIKK